MPPKMKKTCSQKLKVPAGRTKKEKGMDEKENKCSYSELSKAKSPKAPVKPVLAENNEEKQNEFVSPPQTPKLKPTGFWSKKLQDLEENKTKKKCGLYDFSGTDESDSSFKIKKRRPQNARLKKQKQPAQVHKYKKPTTDTGNKQNKIKKSQNLALVKEQIMLNKERKKLDDQNKSFTFSTDMQTLGITSTPAIKKGNLIGASNFLFLSPIFKEEPALCNSVLESSPIGLKVKDTSPLTQHLNNPRIETKLKQISCKRVLRSGKTLGI